jgi:hypothetical protein
MEYCFKQGTWRDAERACDLPDMWDLEFYDAFPDLDYQVYMAKTKNGRLAAIALFYPGVMLMVKERERHVGAAFLLVQHLVSIVQPRLWFHVDPDEEDLALGLGMDRSDIPGFCCSRTFVLPDVTEIEAHRLLRRSGLTMAHDGLEVEEISA